MRYLYCNIRAALIHFRKRATFFSKTLKSHFVRTLYAETPARVISENIFEILDCEGSSPIIYLRLVTLGKIDYINGEEPLRFLSSRILGVSGSCFHFGNSFMNFLATGSLPLQTHANGSHSQQSVFTKLIN